MQVPTEILDMHEKIKEGKLIIYPNAGHGSIFQYAEEFSRAHCFFFWRSNMVKTIQ